MTPRVVSVIVPTFRRFVPLLETLECVLRQDYAPFEVVVADQNSAWPAGLEARLAAVKADARVRWLSLETPGVVVARNRAVAESSGDLLVFIDDDVDIPSRTFLADHVRRYADPTVMAIAGRVLAIGDAFPGATSRVVPPYASAPPDRSVLDQALHYDRQGDVAEEACTFCTCNGSMRRTAFLAVDGFDELFAGHSYGDDTDLALRLHARGLTIIYDPAPWLVHRKVPMGGLRLSDRSNDVDWLATAQGFWLFVLRHGRRGNYLRLTYSHVLRKTVLLRRNAFRPVRQVATLAQVVRAFPRAYARRLSGPESRFTRGELVGASDAPSRLAVDAVRHGAGIPGRGEGVS